MATQATLDKAAALKTQVNTANARLATLKSVATPTTAQQQEIRKLNNQVSQAQYQFRTDKDLLALAGENMTPADKLFLTGLAAGAAGGPGASTAATALVTVAAATGGAAAIAGVITSQPASTNTPAEELPEVLVTAKPIVATKPLPNELHQYPSYTYGISLHLLSPQQYNEEIVDGKGYIPQRVLIASAGRYNTDTFPRSEFFNEDFYFEDLEIETIIGLNSMSRNTNAIAVSFTIIEPYGFTLMERIMKAAGGIDANNYLEMPYLLEIDFFAHNDAGEIVGKLSNITKRIPIKIAALEAKASSKGAEYNIKAYPYNHSAFDATTVSGPKHIEIASGNISEFLGIGEASAPASAAPSNDNGRPVANSPFGTTATPAPTPAILQSSLTPSNYIKATSYASALNSFYDGLENNNSIDHADQYTFSIDPEIKSRQQFKRISNSILSHKSNKMSDKDNSSSIRISNIAGSLASNDFNKNKKLFSIDAGTTIEKVINYIIRMSDYIQNQLAVPEDLGSGPESYTKKVEENKNKELKWFKIIPTVKLGSFDSIRKMRQRTINYHVQPYIVKNVVLGSAPQEVATNPVKSYNYIYSGKNDDILEWDLQFNALYYTAVQVYNNSMAILNTGGTGKNRIKEETANELSTSYKGSIISDPNSVAPPIQKTVIINTQSTSGVTTARERAAADLDESLSTMAGADQLLVNLKIIGDPAYIKQDDIFFSPRAFNSIVEPDPGKDTRVTTNGSIRTDSGEVHVQLLFTTPRDVNESTGFMQFDEDKQVSVFSGLYRVLKVTSSFRQGAFTQNLVLVRLTRQSSYDYTEPVTTPTPTNERLAVDPSIATPASVDDATEVVPSAAADVEEGQKAPANEPVPADDPVVDPDQLELANVAATANTQPI